MKSVGMGHQWLFQLLVKHPNSQVTLNSNISKLYAWLHKHLNAWRALVIVVDGKPAPLGLTDLPLLYLASLAALHQAPYVCTM